MIAEKTQSSVVQRLPLASLMLLLAKLKQNMIQEQAVAVVAAEWQEYLVPMPPYHQEISTTDPTRNLSFQPTEFETQESCW
jgi:hypothetical protein